MAISSALNKAATSDDRSLSKETNHPECVLLLGIPASGFYPPCKIDRSPSNCSDDRLLLPTFRYFLFAPHGPTSLDDTAESKETTLFYTSRSNRLFHVPSWGGKKARRSCSQSANATRPAGIIDRLQSGVRSVKPRWPRVTVPAID